MSDNARVIAHDVGQNTDGLHAVSSATKEHDRSLAKYNEALNRFWKVVLPAGKVAE
jgi:hypothetical protein